MFLGVSPSTLRNWDRTGKVKAARHPVNGYRLYRRDELKRLMKKVQLQNA
jgi:DNA-binding transcriptional MerR regulator